MSKNRKQRQLTNKKKRFLIANVFLAVFLFLGFGYSVLGTNLNIFGDITVKEKLEPTIYNMLKKEAKLGTYAKEYTNIHGDSIDATLSTKPIYYWYALNNSIGDPLAEEILDKWNVIFAGYCWQVFRTTDTGGVKMIYNGTPLNGKCTRTGSGQKIGNKSFNSNVEFLSNIGYMYNDTISNSFKNTSIEETTVVSRINFTGSTNYYYGTGVTWDPSTEKYNLTEITQETWNNTYSQASGLYTCASTLNTSCESVYYIIEGTSTEIYAFLLSSGNPLSYYKKTMAIGDGYTENNGIYSLTNPTIINNTDWISSYNNYNNKYICDNLDTSCSNLKKIAKAEKNKYISYSSLDNYVYANGFNYDSTQHTYTLNSERVRFWDLSTTDNSTSLNNHHYTCFNITGTCEKLSYIYKISPPNIGYFELQDGKSIDDILNENLYDENVNKVNSNIKTYIDNWYQNNLIGYTSYIDDTIFCSDRKPYNSTYNPFNPNGGSVTSPANFGGSSGLICDNETDRFSVSNPKAKLTYPIGLMTSAEYSLLNNDNLRKIGEKYYLMSPKYYDYQPNAGPMSGYINIAWQTGITGQSTLNSSNAVRPVISLKPGIEYSSGDGSRNNPYIVEAEPVY